jgi:hypothetical protein
MEWPADAEDDIFNEPDETYIALALMPRRLSMTLSWVYTYTAHWTTNHASHEFV